MNDKVGSRVISVHVSVYRRLVKIASEEMIERGEKVALGDVIRELLDEQKRESA